jgi:hypothetical protein
MPVQVQNWSRSRSRCSRGNSDDWFAWSYTRGMASSNEGLRMEWVNMRWWKKLSRGYKEMGRGSSSNSVVPSNTSLEVSKRGQLIRPKTR